jgi:hypothetical protein
MFSIRPDLNTVNVLERVSPLDIFKRYCKNFKEVGRKFSDREDDEKSSAIISYYNGDLWYKDFGRPGAYRAIPYVSFKYGIEYREALELINTEFSLGLGNSFEDDNSSLDIAPIRYKSSVSKEVVESIPIELKVRRIPFTQEGLDYWIAHGWKTEHLNIAKIYQISHYWINHPRKNIINWKIELKWNQELAYSLDYYFHKGVFMRKIYRPHEISDYKFMTNADKTVVQNYNMLPKTGDYLFITSSLKDCGGFCNLGYNAIAPNSESSFFPESFVEKIKGRFKYIFIWFDNDYGRKENPGIKSAKHFSEKFGIDYVYNPDNTAKDPSDFIKKYGLSEFNNLINERIFHTRECSK